MIKQSQMVGEELFQPAEPPCLSLYQPTHRHIPENQQDKIRFGNLLRELERSVSAKYPDEETKPILERIADLENDDDLWDHAADGLAVLASKDMFEVFKLQRTVPEIAIAADSFHLKPLMRIVQSADRYNVLALSEREIRLYEGNRDQLDEIPDAGEVPKTIEEALGPKEFDPPPSPTALGGAETEADHDTDRFFRAIDRAVLEHYSSRNRLPLIIAALPEHRARFAEISHNDRLLDKGIDAHPESLTAGELRERAWSVIEPIYLERLKELIEEYGNARAHDLGHEDPAEIAKAAVGGRIKRLLVEAERHVPGRVDSSTGAVEFGDLKDPATDDILDDLAELTAKMGGEVVVVPEERMPTETGLAATYRY